MNIAPNVSCVLSILLGIALVNGCSDDTSGPPAASAIIEPNSRDQLLPLAVGNYWHYRDSGDGDNMWDLDSIVAVDSVWLMYYAPSGAKGYLDGRIVAYKAASNRSAVQSGLWVGDDGIYRGFWTPYGAKDTVHSFDRLVGKHPEVDSVMGSGLYPPHFAAIDSVNVPAGTFPRAYRFESIITDLNGSVNLSQIWMVRGVGCVRTLETTDGKLDFLQELTSYHVQ